MCYYYFLEPCSSPLQFTRGIPVHCMWSLYLKGVRAHMISHLFKVFKGIIISPVLQMSK